MEGECPDATHSTLGHHKVHANGFTTILLASVEVRHPEQHRTVHPVPGELPIPTKTAIAAKHGTFDRTTADEMYRS